MTLLTADEVRLLARQVIEERYENQAQAARTWGLAPTNLNDALQGKRPIPRIVLEKLGLEPVTMYRQR